MSPEEQRIAIAGVCGWLAIRTLRNSEKSHSLEPDHVLVGESPSEGFCPRRIPDYPNDLNAMHEAEKILDGSQIHKYTITLEQVVSRDCVHDDSAWNPRHPRTVCWHAIAAQRAEAFLRTLNLWKGGVE